MITLGVFFFIIVDAAESKSIYVVVKKDTLSNIIYNRFGSPLYGPKGRLKQVIELNPHLRNPDLISLGEIIYLPSDFIEKPELTLPLKIKTVDADEEVKSRTPVEFQSEEIGKIYLRGGIGAVEIEQYDSVNNLPAVVISRNAYFLRVGIDQRWSQKSSFDLSWDLSKIELDRPEGIPLSKTNLNLSKFSGTYFRQVSRPWKLGLRTEIGQLPQLQRQDTTSLKVETLWVPVISPVAIFNRNINRFYDIGIEGNVGYILPALISTKKTKAGYGYELKPYMSLSLKKMQLWFEGAWAERNFSDNGSEVNFQELKFMLGIKFPIVGSK